MIKTSVLSCNAIWESCDLAVMTQRNHTEPFSCSMTFEYSTIAEHCLLPSLVTLLDVCLVVVRPQTTQWPCPGEALWRKWWSREPGIRELLQHPSRQLLLLIPAQQPCTAINHQSPRLSSAPTHHPFSLPPPSGRGGGGARDQRRHRSPCLTWLWHSSQNNCSLLLHGPFHDSPLWETCSCWGFSCWGSGQGAHRMSAADTHTPSGPLQDVGVRWLYRCSQEGLRQQDCGSGTKPVQRAHGGEQDYCWAAVSTHKQWGAGRWVLHLNTRHYATCMVIMTVKLKTQRGRTRWETL